MKTAPARVEQNPAPKSVLHVGEAAAVASVLAKFQRRLGMKADVMSLQEEDPYGYVRFYGGGIKVNQPRLHRVLSAAVQKWRYRAARKKKTRANIEPWKDLTPYEVTENKLLFKIGLQRRWYLRQIIDNAEPYDVIHLHFYPQFAPHIRSRFPEKNIVIHHHGTALRNATPIYRRIQKEYEKSADLVLVSTGDPVTLSGWRRRNSPAKPVRYRRVLSIRNASKA